MVAAAGEFEISALPLFADVVWGDENSLALEGWIDPDDLQKPLVEKAVDEAKARLKNWCGSPDPAADHFQKAAEILQEKKGRWQETWGESVAAGCFSRVLGDSKQICDARDGLFQDDHIYRFAGQSVPDMVYRDPKTQVLYVIEAKGLKSDSSGRGAAKTLEHDDQPDVRRRDVAAIKKESFEVNMKFGRFDLDISPGFDSERSYCEWRVRPGAATFPYVKPTAGRFPEGENRQGSEVYLAELLHRMGCRGNKAYRRAAEQAREAISDAWDHERLVLLGVVGAYAKSENPSKPKHRINFLVIP